MKIHLLGAPGAGISTLGRLVAEQLQCRHFDTDDYHWFTDDPLPYRRRRNPEHRRALLAADLATSADWVLSGSLCGWGDVFIPLFDRAVYIWAPTELRLARIGERERLRYGAERIGPGGDLHDVYEKFCTWAAEYDQDTGRLRSRQQELSWLHALPCQVICIDALLPQDKLAALLIQQL